MCVILAFFILYNGNMLFEFIFRIIFFQNVKTKGSIKRTVYVETTLLQTR